MIKRDNELVYNVSLRRKEYEVFVEQSSTPDTYIRFKYDSCNLGIDVYIPDDTSIETIYAILQKGLKDRIYQYNKMREMKKARKLRDNGTN